MSRLPPSVPAPAVPHPRARVLDGDHFPTTCWGLVGRCAAGDDAQVAAALATMFWRYRPAVLAFVRGHTPCEADAEDLTQGFFAQFFGRGMPGRADPSRGRFRTLVYTCLRRYLHGEAERQHARKRGGGVVLVAWTEAMETSGRLLPSEADPAHVRRRAEEAHFDRQWATVLLAGVFDKLRAEEARSVEDVRTFRHLEPFLADGEGENSAAAHGQAAAVLGVSLGAFRSALHRLRERHRELLRAAVAQTVAEAGEVDAELRHLAAAWAAGGR